MKVFLFDASAAVNLYLPNSPAYQAVIAFLHAKKLDKKALLFIPSFCIAEIKNTFAAERYRHGLAKDKFEECMKALIEHVKNRTVLYSYDLNRYHIINIDRVLEYEHTVNTEYQASGVPYTKKKNQYALADEVKKALLKKGLQTKPSRYHQSTFDLLLISMGIELKSFYGEELFIVTNDKRLNEICNYGHGKEPKDFPTSMLLEECPLAKFEDLFTIA